MVWIGSIGVAALVLCWIPQSVETIRSGRCTVNLAFLLLSAIGSICLALYAVSLGDPVFSVLNVITTSGAALNIYYKLFPRTGSS
ncbi:MAG: hypothetical protein HBSIN02_17380 [Bacteroidia bacterium]|nr:MAG: hypothetical protein HBSIN02_17380 [Bacteroidia bacterium]